MATATDLDVLLVTVPGYMSIPLMNAIRRPKPRISG
jgi:hypothetical protein